MHSLPPGFIQYWQAISKESSNNAWDGILGTVIERFIEVFVATNELPIDPDNFQLVLEFIFNDWEDPLKSCNVFPSILTCELVLPMWI